MPRNLVHKKKKERMGLEGVWMEGGGEGGREGGREGGGVWGREGGLRDCWGGGRVDDEKMKR